MNFGGVTQSAETLPVSAFSQVTIDRISSVVGLLPTWYSPARATSSSSVPTLPLWEYEPFLSMLWRDGALDTIFLNT